jgi:hypothetical protein
LQRPAGRFCVLVVQVVLKPVVLGAWHREIRVRFLPARCNALGADVAAYLT